MASVAEFKKSFLAEIDKIESREELEKLRVKYLGREKGLVTAVLRSLGGMPIEKRKEIGPQAQGLKQEIEKLLSNRKEILETKETMASVDLTAPGRKPARGHLHPLTLVEDEIRRIFMAMNFSVVEGPEVESDYYNFDALNILPDHPARDAWDTIWLRQNQIKNQKSKIKNGGRLLLRTHTSPVQIRYMEEHKPPFQIIVPGRVFRYEATDASHEVNFYQFEGLMVGKNVTFANFKFVIEEFFKRFFSAKGGSASGGKRPQIEFRYRPSYFPFTEPSVEVDIKLGGKWLEVMGAGMVNPRVFEYAHYNPRDFQGFAFGMGVDRLAMIKYKIPDIRMFYSGDLRFIKQF